MNTPAISVVIPARNAEATLGDQLAALEGQMGAPAFEVIVADNGSTDGTAAIVDRWADRLAVRVVDARRAPGVNVARNAGWRAAKAPLVAFCDADDRVDPHWVAAMAAALDEHQAVGGRLDTVTGNPPDLRERHGGVGEGGLTATIWKYPTVIGANMGFRRDLLERFDGFAEAYRDGGDETDLSWRVAIEGIDVGWEPEAVVQYTLRPTRTALYRQYRAYGIGEAHLYAHFRAEGMPRRPLPRVAVSWIATGARFVWFVGPRRQGKAIRALGFQVGRVRGSIRHRVLFL